MKTISYCAYRAYDPDYTSRAYDPSMPNGTIGYFKYESDAKMAAKGKSSYGADGSVERVVETIRIFDDLQEYHYAVAEDKRVRDLAKLTEEERKLLGLG